jgi:hypothetical protein
VGNLNLEKHSRFETSLADELMEARRHRRFKLEVKICVYPRDCPVVRGDTVDISESGISALLREEVPIGEVVRLELALPSGEVELLAFVRQRSAFRFGFQFVESNSAGNIIGRICAQLALEQPDRGHDATNSALLGRV